MIDQYDILRDTQTMSDGVVLQTWVFQETRKMEVQPIRFSAERNATVVEIQIGGEKYIPSYRGWLEQEVDITATDRITSNSGTTNLMVLRCYEYEDHKEIDLREVSD